MSRKPVQPDAAPSPAAMAAPEVAAVETTAAADPAADPTPAPVPLPQGGGAFTVIDGALVEDQGSDPPTKMPGATRAETTR
jgi:hypothetical protein